MKPINKLCEMMVMHIVCVVTIVLWRISLPSFMDFKHREHLCVVNNITMRTVCLGITVSPPSVLLTHEPCYCE